MLADIREILIISTPEAINSYQQLLKSGEQLGLSIQYLAQAKPEGIAQAFILAEEFIGDGNVALILGDNIFHGHNLGQMLSDAAKLKTGAHIFGYYVQDPERYGVAEVGESNKVLSIEEKPKYPKSNYAVTGLYFYDNKVIDIAKQLKPSARGELEITDVNNYYLKNNSLVMTKLTRGFAWLDTGTHQSYLEASNFIAAIENRQGLKVGCIEEIAYSKNYIDADQIQKLAAPMHKTEYGQYLLKLLEKDYVY
jgi:glucose-1-phosphate thymidylyltransferase